VRPDEWICYDQLQYRFSSSTSGNALFVSGSFGNLSLNGNLVLPGQSVLVRSEGFLEIAGTISGTGDLQKNGQGQVSFAGQLAQHLCGRDFRAGGNFGVG